MELGQVGRGIQGVIRVQVIGAAFCYDIKTPRLQFLQEGGYIEVEVLLQIIRPQKAIEDDVVNVRQLCIRRDIQGGFSSVFTPKMGWYSGFLRYKVAVDIPNAGYIDRHKNDQDEADQVEKASDDFWKGAADNKMGSEQKVSQSDPAQDG